LTSGSGRSPPAEARPLRVNWLDGYPGTDERDLRHQQEDGAMRGHQVLLARTLVIAGMTLGLAGGALAGDGPKCTVDTLDGLYVFTATGWGIAPGAPPPAVLPPKAIIEVIRFNGDGTLDVVGGTRTLNGVIAQNLVGPGTYTVQDLDGACAGSLTFDH